MHHHRLLGLGLLLFVLGASLLHCGENEPPEGLFVTVPTKGPKVVFDLDAKPLPEIPLPIDLATLVDPTSPTHLRVNVSMIAPTHLEATVRAKVNRLSGFGVYTPITVRFTAPIEVGDVIKRHQTNNDFQDDVVFVVCLNPTSPMYGKPVLLDMGRGNFPTYLERPSNYFDFDPHAGQNNILFETVGEKDLNGNGKLDPDEDLDHDGVWDKPNTFPADSQDKDHLLNWYERETNTLIMRPVIPLQPSSQYAVIITSRIKDEQGRAVTSPFPTVNHTRQTPALRRLVDDKILEKLGLKQEDVAFVWGFTTQNGYQDLKLLRDGIYGHGPFRDLTTRYPANLSLLHPLQDEGDKRWILLGDTFRKGLGSLASLVLPGNKESQDALLKSFEHIDYVVSGEFITPYFLAARDKSGNVVEGAAALAPGIIPTSKTHFDIDSATGRMVVGKDKVTWWCAIPKQTAQFKAPFPVSFYGHGYTSTRFEILGFAGSMARHGLATCGVDAVGHGAALSPSELRAMEAILKLYKMQGTYLALSPGRARDLNNDGYPDSGGDFWTADTFHTRDVVRQSVLDHMMLIRIMRSWDGKKQWSLDGDGDGKPDVKGIAGDFNGDGVVDLGGPSTDYFTWGQSLGGILSGILAGIEPAIVASAPVSGGGGLLQIGVRSVQGGVVEAVYLRMMGPLVMGYQLPDKKMELRFWVPDVNKKPCSLTLDIAAATPGRDCQQASRNQRVQGVRFTITQNEIQAGDKIVIKNLRSGESRWALVRKYDDTLGFRFAIPADALDPLEKRAVLKIPDDPLKLREPTYKLPEIHAGTDANKLKIVSYPDGADGKAQNSESSLIGDPLEITIYKGTSSEVRETIKKFGVDAYFQGAIYKAGTPLFAIAEGLGLRRQSPDFRRFQGFAGMILEPGDPIVYAPLYHLQPIRYHYETKLKAGSNVLVVPTLGDMNVPVDTGIAIARGAGIISVLAGDPRYPDPDNKGQFLTANQYLLRNYVVEGADTAGRFFDPDTKKTVLFDPDNLSLGTDGFGAPRGNPPLRLQVRTENGVAGMRIPYVKQGGEHGFATPEPSLKFDVHTFMINQIALYFRSKGTKIDDRHCLHNNSCPDLPK